MLASKLHLTSGPRPKLWDWSREACVDHQADSVADNCSQQVRRGSEFVSSGCKQALDCCLLGVSARLVFVGRLDGKAWPCMSKVGLPDAHRNHIVAFVTGPETDPSRKSHRRFPRKEPVAGSRFTLAWTDPQDCLSAVVMTAARRALSDSASVLLGRLVAALAAAIVLGLFSVPQSGLSGNSLVLAFTFTNWASGGDCSVVLRASAERAGFINPSQMLFWPSAGKPK